MAQGKEAVGARRQFGDFAPAVAEFTDDVLSGQVWTRPELSPKERSLVTVAALTTSGNTGQLAYHLGLANRTVPARHSSSRRSPTWPFVPAGRTSCRQWPWPGGSSAASNPSRAIGAPATGQTKTLPGWT